VRAIRLQQEEMQGRQRRSGEDEKTWTSESRTGAGCAEREAKEIDEDFMTDSQVGREPCPQTETVPRPINPQASEFPWTTAVARA
jgi:hypothetical protein